MNVLLGWGGLANVGTILICRDGNRTALSVCVSRLESPGVQLHIFVGAKDAWQTLSKGDKGWSWRRGVTADKPRMGLRERLKKWAGRGWRGCKVIHNKQGWVTALSVSLSSCEYGLHLWPVYSSTFDVFSESMLSWCSVEVYINNITSSMGQFISCATLNSCSQFRNWVTLLTLSVRAMFE